MDSHKISKDNELEAQLKTGLLLKIKELAHDRPELFYISERKYDRSPRVKNKRGIKRKQK